MRKLVSPARCWTLCLSATTVALLACAGASAEAATLYADSALKEDITNGAYDVEKRDATGADGNAYATIQAAVDAMQPGDTLLLRGGTFKEHSISLWNKRGTIDAWFAIRSCPGEWAVVDAEHTELENGKMVDVFRSGGTSETCPIFWRFEQFEVTGAGPALVGSDGQQRTYDDIQSKRGAGFHLWPARHIVFDHMFIHDNYGGGGPNGGAGIKIQNETGGARHITVTHCYFKDNGWPGSNNGNLSNITLFTDYGWPRWREIDVERACTYNEICYNLFDGSSKAFRHKGMQMLCLSHAGDDLKAKDRGDRIHHNIIRNCTKTGIQINQDFAQIHHNIIESCPIGILISQTPSHGYREPFYVAVYNNLVKNPSKGGILLYRSTADKSYNYLEPPCRPFYYLGNNIVDIRDVAPTGDAVNQPLGLFPTWTKPWDIDWKTVHIGSNYLHGKAPDHPAVRIANRTYSAEECLRQRWAADFYASKADEAEPLYKTGSNYKTRAEYPLTRNETVADGGAPGPHPYLEGERIPAYLGAMDPENDDWVDTVLELARIAGPQQPIYAWIETNKGSRWMTYSKQLDVEPKHTRCETWMAIIRGATAIGYFTHRWRPDYKQFAPEEEMVAELKRLNGQITRLAPAILATPAKTRIEMTLDGGLPCHCNATECDGALHIFAQNIDLGPEPESKRQFEQITPRAGKATITVEGLKAGTSIEVIDEDRTIKATAGKFTDDFAPLSEHIYRLDVPYTYPHPLRQTE